MFSIDKSIKKILGGTSRSRTPQPLVGVRQHSPKFSSKQVAVHNFDAILKKQANLLKQAKASVFFPFTQPTVRSPTGKKIKGRMPTVDRVMKNFFDKNKFNNKNDWDSDGVPNKKDCQPRNPMRQDAIPNPLLKKRIDKLDVRFIEQRVDKKGKTKNIQVGLTEHTNNPNTNKAKKSFYGSLKRTPGLIKEIEKTKSIVFINPNDTGEPYTEPVFDYSNKRVGSAISLPESFVNDDRKMRSYTLAHELQHSHQSKDNTLKEYEKRRKQNIKQPWMFRKDEIEADKFAYEQMRKHAVAMKPRQEFDEYIKMRQDKNNKVLGKPPPASDVPSEQVIKEEQITEAYRKMYEDKDKDGIIAAADNDDNNPENPSGAHYGELKKEITPKELSEILIKFGSTLNRRPIIEITREDLPEQSIQTQPMKITEDVIKKMAKRGVVYITVRKDSDTNEYDVDVWNKQPTESEYKIYSDFVSPKYGINLISYLTLDEDEVDNILLDLKNKYGNIPVVRDNFHGIKYSPKKGFKKY